MAPTEVLRVVLCHSGKDKRLTDPLLDHLRALEQFKGIRVWSDERIAPGDDRHREFDSALRAADVAILLVSAAFLVSTVARNLQVPAIVDRHRRRILTVIPVIIRACTWEADPFLSSLEVLPSSRVPIANYPTAKRHDVFTELSRAVLVLAQATRNVRADHGTAVEPHHSDLALSHADERTPIRSARGFHRTSTRGTASVLVVRTRDAHLLGTRIFLQHNPTRIGRATRNHVVLSDEWASRFHGHLELSNNEWHVVDNLSTNGTLCDGQRFSAKKALEHGSCIRIGETVLKFLGGQMSDEDYQREVVRLTTVDGLTQVLRRSYFFSMIDDLIRDRGSCEVAMVLFDIDGFTDLNETSGYFSGDCALETVARIGMSYLPKNATLARVGVDEFGVLVNNAPEKDVRDCMVGLRDAIEGHHFVFQAQRRRVTISVGIAFLQETDRAAIDLVARAEEQLRKAKQDGGNSISVEQIDRDCKL